MAVKQFRLGFSPESAARFVAALEGIVAADLTHTGIAAPIAAGAIDNTPYLALDFVAADSLDVVIREYGPLPIGDVLRFTRQLGRALDVAAGAGVLHGALHPRDLLMTADDVRITGLGIAAALEEVGMIAPIRRPYSAPERSVSGGWDRRADVFSLAALTYEMLFGRPIVGVGADAADGITTIEGADSEALHRLFSKALAGDPTQRIATASAFVTDLRAILPSPDRHPAGSGKRKKGEPAPTESLFDEPMGAPAPTSDVRFDHNLFRDGDYVEGDARPETAADPVAPRDFDLNLAAIDLRFDENVREGSELRLRAEAEASAAPAGERVEHEVVAAPPGFAPAGAYVEADDHPRDEEALISPWSRDRESVEARQEREPALVREPSLEVDSDEDPDADRHAAPDAGVPPTFARLDSPADDVSLSPVTPAYSTLPGEAPASSNWPILLGVVLGLLVGTAFGYFMGTRQRAEPAGAVTAATGAADSGRPIEQAQSPSSPTTTSGATASGEPSVTSTTTTPAPSARGSVANGAAGVSATPSRPAAAPAAAAPAATARGAASSAPRPTGSNRAASSPAAAPRTERARPATEGRLVVRSTPPGARVSLDGRDAGVTPATLTNLAAGAHNVRVSRDGYVTAERRVRIRAAQTTQSIDVTLAAVRPVVRPQTPAARPAPAAAAASASGASPTTGGQGSLTVDSRPSGARVFIDGRPVGVTPLQIDSVGAGSHAVRLELDGFGPWATTVQVARGQRARVSGSLER